MAFTFQEATEATGYLRVALAGPSGSGKTYSALQMALGITGGNPKKIGFIDTERGSALKYKKYVGSFLHGNLNDFHPRNFVEAIDAYVAAGVEVIIIDSLSHAWEGTGGVLSIVEAKQKTQANKYTAWSDGTYWQNKLIDKLLQAPVHIIVAMRTKNDTVLDEKGKPQVVGLKPIQREGMEYEFDVLGMFYGRDHLLIIQKTRFSEIDGQDFDHPGKQFGKMLLDLNNENELDGSRMTKQEAPVAEVVEEDDIPIDKPGRVSADVLLSQLTDELDEQGQSIAAGYVACESKAEIRKLDREVSSVARSLPQEIRNVIRQVRDARNEEVA